MGSNAGPVPAPSVVPSCTRPGPLCVALDATMGSDASAGYMAADDKYASALVQAGFAALAASMQQMEGSTMTATDAAAGSVPVSTQNRWQQVTAKARAASSAADITAAARLKALQKTPFPMVIARMKVLLERLNHLMHDCRPATASAIVNGCHSTRQSVASLSDGYASSLLLSSAKPQVNGHKTPTSGTRTPGSVNTPGSKGAKAMFSSSGGVVDSITLQLSMQAVLQELEVLFGFVSEFLAKVPQETRLALAKVARLQNYKKDQVIYDIGQQADNFYIILSGRIDIWSHPPGCARPKTTVSVLRKGDTFGDQAIINKARHSTAASPGCNASLLVVSKEDFLTVFGPYFQGVAASWTDFLRYSVSPFQAAQLSEVQQLCSAMVSSKPPPNKEFDLQQDQVFFVKEGTFELQLIDLVAQKAADSAVASAAAAASAMAATATTPARIRSNSSSSTAADAPASSTSEREVLEAATAGFSLANGLDGADSPTLGTHGVLASVRVKDGRALGTLGYERELRRQRHASVPRKTVAVLGPGSWFGGGCAIYGSGSVQSALRVVAQGPGPFELIHLPLEGIEEHGGEALIRRLRDDAAFTCTYYLGRLGLLPGGTAVGHPYASLLSASAAATDLAVPALATTARSAGMAPTAGAGWCSRNSASIPGTPKQAAIAAAVMGIHGAHATAATQCSAAQSYSNAAVTGAVPQNSSVLGFKPGQAAASVSEDLNAAAAQLNSSIFRRTGRQRQKYVHVAGSGVYSPGTMAALQHVQSLQAEFTANKKPPLARAAQQQELQSASGSAAVQAGPSSAGTVQTAGSRSSGPGGIKSSSRLGGSIRPRTSSNRGGAYNGTACTSTSAADGGCDCGVDGAVTAAERYWAQPGHSSSTTAAALNPLLSSLFTDGLQPLVRELDCLMDHAQAKGRQVPCLDAPGATEAAVAATAEAGSLHQQRRPSSASRMPYVPASGMAKARVHSRPCSAGVGPPASWHWGGLNRAAVGQAPAGQQKSRPSTCAGIPNNVLQHRPYSSLLAATVMWQRSSDLSFRPPLRQCLTSAEIDQQPLDRAMA